MEELELLRKRLEEAQSPKSSHNLSEKNVIDVIDKLKRKKKLKIFFSSDGNEFVTPGRIERDIYDVLVVHKRVHLVDLPELLNIPQEKAIKYAKSLAQKKPSQKFNTKVYFVKESIFLESYLEEILAIVKEELIQQGLLDLAAAAAGFNLPAEFLIDFVARSLAGDEVTFLGKEKVLTQNFYRATEAKVRGALRGCFKPVELLEVAKHHDIRHADINIMTQAMIQNEQLDGKVSNGVYSPTIFLRNQESIIKKFFTQNDYVDYGFIEKNLNVPKPLEYLKNLFKSSALMLETCCFNSAALITKRHHIQSILEEEGFVDLWEHLPTLLTAKDLDTIVWKHWEITEEIFEGSFLISQEFVEKCSEAFGEIIADKIMNSPFKLLEKTEAEASQSKGKRKFKTAGKSSSGKKLQLFSSEEIISHLKKKEILKDEEPELEPILADILQDKLEGKYEEVKVRLFESKKIGAIAVNNELLTKIEDLMIIIQLGERSLVLLENYDVGGKTTSLQENLMTSARCLIEHLVLFICQKNNISIPNTVFQPKKVEESKKKNCPSNTGLQNKIFKNYALATNTFESLPPFLVTTLKEMNSSITKRNMDAFLSKGVEKLVEQLNLTSKLDLKAERNFLSLIKSSAREAIKSAGSPQSIFFKLLLILTADLGFLFVFTEEDEKIMVILAKLMMDLSKDADIKSFFQQALETYRTKRSLKSIDSEFLSDFIKKMRY